MDPVRVRDVRRAVMAWYRANGRHSLPWRETRDPYAVLVSEIMLQQTQVDRVLPYYTAWLGRWPTFETLASANAAEAIEQWAGLGYNRRAVNLRRLACAVAESYGGRLPREQGALRSLPGIGPYTASAVRSFAFEQRLAVVDTNVGRVLVRMFAGVPSMREASAPLVAGIAATTLPRRSVRDHNLALMDLGAMVCRARVPDCGVCPIATMCAWRLAGYPAKTRRVPASERFETTARFARGRIVDALRGGMAMATDELAAALPATHRARAGVYLDGLMRDGLVECIDGRWRLPR